MDGDGQHLPSDIPRLLAAAERYPEHLVIGARIKNRETQPKARRRANDFADWGISWGCGIPVADTHRGLRAHHRVVPEVTRDAAADLRSGARPGPLTHQRTQPQRGICAWVTFLTCSCNSPSSSQPRASSRSCSRASASRP
jgi:hypothetical protein